MQEGGHIQVIHKSHPKVTTEVETWFSTRCDTKRHSKSKSKKSLLDFAFSQQCNIHEHRLT